MMQNLNASFKSAPGCDNSFLIDARVVCQELKENTLMALFATLGCK